VRRYLEEGDVRVMSNIMRGMTDADSRILRALRAHDEATSENSPVFVLSCIVCSLRCLTLICTRIVARE
jgi:hypothetical protein